MDTKRVIIHELAHILYLALSKEERKSYWDSSSWTDADGVFVINRVSFSEADGRIGPEEDFANNIEHYFSNPKTFKKNFPKINAWIKKFIGANK